MCDAHIINSVKEKMLSRRDFLRRAGATAAAATAAATVAAPLTAQAAHHELSIKDLTHTLHEKFPTFGGTQQFSKKALYNYADNGFTMFEVTFNEHTGTHMDAPLHFSATGSVDSIAPENLFAPLCIVDIRDKAADDDNAQVTPDDLRAWISKNGDIPAGACIAMNSGWEKYVDTPQFRNPGTDGGLNFPGFHLEAAQMLLETTDAVGIAVDTLSIDYGPSPDFAVHNTWLPQNRWGLECVANLSALPAAGASIVVGAPKFSGGSGGPTRVFALV